MFKENSLPLQGTLFEEDPTINLSKIVDPGEGMTVLRLSLDGEPMSKQSTRMAVKRYFQDGYHHCPFTNKEVWHKKGDVLVYKNKQTGLRDVILTTYTDTKRTNKAKEYKLLLQSQINKKYPGFNMFTEKAHILMLEYIYPCLKSFSKKKVEAIREGEIIEKTTTPDLPDNLKKLVLDSMAGIVYEDDKLISREYCTIKRYGIKPCINIIIRGK